MTKEERQKAKEKLNDKITQLRSDLYNLEAEYYKLDQIGLDEKIKEADKFFGKYIVINSSTYMYVSDINCAYNGKVYGLSGPRIKIDNGRVYGEWGTGSTAQNEFMINNIEDVKVITKKEFSNLIEKELTNIKNEIIGQCVPVCNPTYLEQSKTELKTQYHENTKYRPIKGRRNI